MDRYRAGNEIKLMLVDDHPVLREGLRLILERQPGLRVVAEAGDGESAVRLAEECSPDVVLMDIAMPHLDGVQATRLLRSKRPEVRVLVLTNYDADEYVRAMLEAGVCGYLLKSVGVEELVSAIRVAYLGGCPLPASIASRLASGHTGPARKPNGESASPAERLTPRELDVIRLAAQGMSNQSIAEALCLSLKTIENYMSNIYEKLGVQDRTQAVLVALKSGIANL